MEFIKNNTLRILLTTVLVVVVTFLLQSDVIAQCAMCRATAEGGSPEKQEMARALNTGILYLMVIPYIAISLIAYFWYKNSRRVVGDRDDY